MKSKVCQPRKITGGSIVGKEGQLFYAIKCNALDREQEKRFRNELKEFVRNWSPCVEEIEVFSDQ